MEKKEKPGLDMRQDSGIACFTPSPPPKKSSLPRGPGNTHSASGHRELRRRLPSREMQRVSPDTDASEVLVELPPKLDLRSLIGSDSDSDIASSRAVSTDHSYRSDDCTNLELAPVAMETPSSDDNSRMSVETSTPDGYQSDAECSSASPAAPSYPSPSSLELSSLRRYGSGGLEEESEGSVLKVKLKIRSSDQENTRVRKSKARSSAKESQKQRDVEGSDISKSPQPSDSGGALSKYAPLPEIGHKGNNLETVPQKHRIGQNETAKVVMEEKENTRQLPQEEIREQRLRALERSTSQTEISTQKRVPMPPPQSAKTVSRRAMRMQQFARRKSASQAEALMRQKSLTSGTSHSQVGESESCRSLLLAVRLPTGKRVQNIFKASDTLRTVADFAIQSDKQCSLDITRVCLVTSDSPKRVWTELALTIEAVDVKDRTLLHLEEMD